MKQETKFDNNNYSNDNKAMGNGNRDPKNSELSNNKIVNGEDQNLVVNTQEENEEFSTSDNLKKSYEQGIGNENISNNDRLNDDDDEKNDDEDEIDKKELPGEYDDSEKTIKETPKMK